MPRSHSTIPADLRVRLEAARLDLLTLFRALDTMNLSPREITQRLLSQLFELDADYVEALWALDQPPGSLDLPAMVRDTLAALEQLPAASARTGCERTFPAAFIPSSSLWNPPFANLSTPAKLTTWFQAETTETGRHPRKARLFRWPIIGTTLENIEISPDHSGKHVPQKLVRCVAFAFLVFTNEMIIPTGAAVQRYQVQSGNGLRIRITLFAESTLPFATNVERYKVVYWPGLAGIERQRRSVERTRIEMAENLLQLEPPVRANPTCSDFMDAPVEISIQGNRGVGAWHPLPRQENPAFRDGGKRQGLRSGIPASLRVRHRGVHLDCGIGRHVDIAV